MCHLVQLCGVRRPGTSATPHSLDTRLCIMVCHDICPCAGVSAVHHSLSHHRLAVHQPHNIKPAQSCGGQHRYQAHRTYTTARKFLLLGLLVAMHRPGPEHYSQEATSGSQGLACICCAGFCHAAWPHQYLLSTAVCSTLMTAPRHTAVSARSCWCHCCRCCHQVDC